MDLVILHLKKRRGRHQNWLSPPNFHTEKTMSINPSTWRVSTGPRFQAPDSKTLAVCSQPGHSWLLVSILRATQQDN
ncbi:hypothetical protein TNCV_3352561 [Trichonephila clavipes]|nr:hypothetical protein TNCV_3352561 [Trichonephila clavipes]